jgi:small GTP-binding protein
MYAHQMAGIDFKIRTVHVDGFIIKLQLWDTAGQERFRTITRAYFRGAHAVLVVYDITKSSTFDALQRHISTLRDYAPNDVSVIICGNKLDVAQAKPERRKVDWSAWSQSELTSSVNSLSERVGAIAHFETSASTGENIDAVFESVCRSVLRKRRMYPDQQKEAQTERMDGVGRGEASVVRLQRGHGGGQSDGAGCVC